MARKGGDKKGVGRKQVQPGVELVFGIAGPVGADLGLVARSLSDALRNAGYVVHEVRLSEWIKQMASRLELHDGSEKRISLVNEPEEERIRSHMDAGNAIRRETGEGAALVHAAIAGIHEYREKTTAGRPVRTAYILRSLKHEEEVFLLRRVYGPAFFLVGINVRRDLRVTMLAELIAKSHGEGKKSKQIQRYRSAAEGLVDRDEREIGDPFGQRLREVFQLADLFIQMAGDSNDEEGLANSFARFVGLVLSDPFSTPTDDERLMYLAYASSLSSGALGRQVGSVVSTPAGEVLGVGWNDVPKGGGGLYRAGSKPDHRDIHRKRDSSQEHSEELVEELLQLLRNQGVEVPATVPGLSQLPVMSLIEFGRATHAEMEAIVSAARVGVSVRGATLYSTTFPCHECARLIVTAGIRRVVFVEPYPKSKALELHADAMTLNPVGGKSDASMVALESFQGVGPRRFAELFSIMPTFGNRLERKDKSGFRLEWKASESQPRTHLVPLSYLEVEVKSIDEIKRFIDMP